jgi:hypothetical protein
VAWSLETDELLFDCSAAGTPKLDMRESQATQITAEAEMPERNFRMIVDMHPLSAFTTAFVFR